MLKGALGGDKGGRGDMLGLCWELLSHMVMDMDMVMGNMGMATASATHGLLTHRRASTWRCRT